MEQHKSYFGDSSTGFSLFNSSLPNVQTEPHTNTNDGWTFEETKIFETALCNFTEIAFQAFYQHVALKMPWKSIESIKHHNMSLMSDLKIIESSNFEDQFNQREAEDSKINEHMEQMLFEASNSTLPNLTNPESLPAANLSFQPKPADAFPETGPKTAALSFKTPSPFTSHKRSIDEVLGDEDQVEDLVHSTKRGHGKGKTIAEDAFEFEVLPEYAQQLGDSASLLVPDDIFACLAAQSPEKAQELTSRHVVKAAFPQTQFYSVNQETMTQDMANKKNVAELQASLVKEKETALNSKRIIACLKEQLMKAEGESKKMFAAMQEKVIAAQAEKDLVRQELEGKLKDMSQNLKFLHDMLVMGQAEKVEVHDRAYIKGQLDYLEVMVSEYPDFNFSKLGANVVKLVKGLKAKEEAKKAVEGQTDKAAGSGVDKNQE